MSELFLNHIREKRMEHGYNTYELSLKLNISPSLLQLWENGVKAIPTNQLIQLSKLFNCSCHELLFKDKEQIISLENLSVEQIDIIINLYNSFK